MSTLITADLQLSAHPRDAYRWRVFDQLGEIGRRHKCEALHVLGDLTEEKDRHSAWLVNTIATEFKELTKTFKIIRVLRGNHDYLSLDNPFFAFLSLIPGIAWINAPLLSQTGRDTAALFLPHAVNPKLEWKNVPLNGHDWIFAHNTFADAISESGFKLRGIPLDIFPKGARVISGDVHVPQKIGCVTYVGAPYLVKFGDDFDPRVLLIDDKDKLKSIPVDGPQKRLIVINTVADLRKEPVVEGDILKVRVHITNAEKAAWQEISEQVRAWGEKKGCLVYSVSPIAAEGDAPRHETIALPSDHDLIKTYAKQRKLDPATIKVGEKFLEPS